MTASIIYSEHTNHQMKLVDNHEMNKNTGDDDDDDEYIKLCHQLAADFVENIINLASNEAAIRLNKSQPHAKQLGLVTRPSNFTPSIQIDLAGTRSPSPEEETFPWIKAAQQNHETQSNDPYEKSKVNTGEINDDDIPLKIQFKPPSSSSSSATQEPLIEKKQMAEIQQFAVAYVKDIISKAIVIASNHEPTFASIKSEISHSRLATSNLSWIERIRQFFRRFITRTCLCKTKHDSTDSFRAIQAT